MKPITVTHTFCIEVTCTFHAYDTERKNNRARRQLEQYTVGALTSGCRGKVTYPVYIEPAVEDEAKVAVRIVR